MPKAGRPVLGGWLLQGPVMFCHFIQEKPEGLGADDPPNWVWKLGRILTPSMAAAPACWGREASFLQAHHLILVLEARYISRGAFRPRRHGSNPANHQGQANDPERSSYRVFSLSGGVTSVPAPGRV